MKQLRNSILIGKFPEFVKKFMEQQFPDGCYEQWAVDALKSVNIDLTT